VIGAGYRGMFRSLVQRLLLVSILPLLVTSVANFLLFFSLNRSIVLGQDAALVSYHRASVEAFLGNITAELSTLARTYSLEELSRGDLERVFRVIREPGGVFTDIGIIDSAGNHLKYVGPYDLAGRNYRDADWFAKVVEKGVFISDTFLGFRGEPHFVIAVKRPEGRSFWILRATVNTDRFSTLVGGARLGETGESFIVNSRGLYQTKTRSASALLEPSGCPDLEPHPGIRVRRATLGGTRTLLTTAWLTDPRWMLVFRQEESEAFQFLTKAVIIGIVMTAGGVIGAGILASVVARTQVRRIERADHEKELLTQQLVTTGRIAAVGEMSAGLAHGINNPLATIDTLQTWIRDLAGTAPISEEDRKEILDSVSKIGEQVVRCKTITQGLLKFARRVETKPGEADLNALLSELATIMRSRSAVEGVTISTSLEPIPSVVASLTKLQEIFMNLVNNAVDAAAGRPGAEVRITSRLRDGLVCAEVADNGPGIPPENLPRIFQPFFTTKPAGRGTGLGLTICQGLVTELGGSLSVESAEGKGTTMTVLLPPAPSTSPPKTESP
jgi:two-component system NtrC family sensor kinase